MASATPKKILLLGSGFVAGPCAEYLARNPTNTLTVACRTLSAASALCAPLPRASPMVLDVAAPDTTTLDAAVAAHDLVISLVPYVYHAAVVQAAIKGRTHVVTTSYISPALRALDDAAKAAGIVVLNEAGLDPGIDHISAVKVIDGVHAKGGKVKEFHLNCGALPAPECGDNPLGYKFSWSPRGGLLALLNPASFLANGTTTHVAGGADLMLSAQPCPIAGFAPALEAFPNRDSVPFREFYRIPEAKTIVRGTLRYVGFTAFMAALIKLGWLAADVKEWLVDGMTWCEATKQVCGASGSDEAALIARIGEVCTFPSEAESERIIAGMRWMGLFSAEKMVVRGGTLLDTLCARLEVLMKYRPGERDLVLLQQKFVVERADGKEETITTTLEEYGTPGGHSAMARTVGIPCGIASQLVLDSVFSTPGVHAPYSKEFCDPIREKLEKEGLGLTERVL
ncbi:Saccharopine dehydrogenase [Mycena sanguinolenta]|uniref:Saccharopine dehydrogenase n=1 Tax=Mycena sanguinolenta TaxID=230812 RepID=A0A8H6ZAY1_9AGAR|nr:Saccharopine dehydrogenase [Mycena sanguinolenta]